MPKFIRYQWSGDERPTPPTPLPIDDNSSDWWQGVAQSFAAVAIGAAVAANALAAQLPYAGNWQQEEIVPQPPPVLDDGAWLPPPPQSLSYFVSPLITDDEVLPAHAFEDDSWKPPVVLDVTFKQPIIDQDEIPAGSLYGQYDEDFWQNPTAPVPPSLTPPSPWQWEQNEQAVLWGVPEESEWIQLVKPDTQWTVRVFSDDDTVATHITEDEWLPPVIQPPTGLPQIFSFNDEVVVVTGVMREEDYWQNQTAPVPPTLQVPNPWDWEQNEQATDLRGVPVETDWIPPVVVAPVSAVRPFVSDEDYHPVVDDTYEWKVLPSQQPNVVPQAFSFNDEIEQQVVVDESEWIPAVVWPITQVSIFGSDDDFVPTVTVALDSDEWNVFVPSLQERVVQPFVSDEEIAFPAVSIIEDETGWINKPMVMPSLPPVVFLFNDEWAFDEFEGEPPPFSQRGCCNISGTTVVFSGCDEGNPVVFDDCPCPS